MEQSETIYALVDNCRKALQSQGVLQWTEHYPQLSTIREDIRCGYLYQLHTEHEILGVVNISTVQEEEYRSITWELPEFKSMVIHRLAVDPQHQGKGYGRLLMDFAEDLAAQQGYQSIRLDAYSGNGQVLKLYEQRGYAKRGEVYFPHRTLPFYCYEKDLQL